MNIKVNNFKEYLLHTKKGNIIIVIISLIISILFSEYFIYTQKKSFEMSENRKNELLIRKIASSLEYELSRLINPLIALEVLMESDEAHGRKIFPQIAKNIYKSIPYLKSIYLAKDNVVSQIYPLKGNEEAIGLNLITYRDEKNLINKIMKSGETIFVGPYKLVQGGSGLISRNPMYYHSNMSKYWGLSGMVIEFDKFLEIIGLTKMQQNYDFIIQKKDGSIIFQNGKNIIKDKKTTIVSIDHFGQNWTLSMKEKNQKQPLIFLFLHWFGIIFSIIFSLLIFLLLNSRKNFHTKAHYDELTNLPNVRTLNIAFNKYIQNHKLKKSFLLLYMDIDKFKLINDTLGHLVGDIVLQKVSKRFQSGLRKGDFISRVGGDEFIALINEDIDNNKQKKIINKINEIMKEPLIINEKKINVSVSVGCSVYPQDSTNMNELIKIADERMYDEKKRKKNLRAKNSISYT